jgi:hypothetical protein
MDDYSDGAGIRGKYVRWKIFPPYWVGDITMQFWAKILKVGSQKRDLFFEKEKKRTD